VQQPGSIQIPTAGVVLEGDLDVPAGATGVVVFAHGSGSSRSSPRNALVAARLREHRLGTLLFDLLTTSEEREDQYAYRYRFDIDLLAERLVAATEWLAARSDTPAARGLFGASTGAAAALVAAARVPSLIRAVVSRGGRPDLAGDALEHVHAPTLLIVGGKDDTCSSSTAARIARCVASAS
jgi:dienelactone hydrolase